MCVDLSVIPTCQFLADLALLVSLSLSPSVRLPDACFSRITQCFSSTSRASAKETQLASTALGAIVSDVSARVWKSVFCHIGDAGSQHQRMLCVHLLPPYSQNGTVPSFCARYGGLNEYLYSKRRCTCWLFAPVGPATSSRTRSAAIAAAAVTVVMVCCPKMK